MDVRAYLAEHGIEADRILLLTNLRVLGYVFNPVSFFYCYQGGELACIVAEVSNTFGERLPYLLSPANRERDERRLSYRHDKKLHVSPFFGLDQSYQWWFSEPGEQLDVRIDAQRRRRAAVLRHPHRTATPFDRRDPRPRAAPLPADAAAGDRPDPPAGRAALAEARAVLPQAAVRARRGIGEAVTEVLRELPAGRRIGARLAESAAIRALGRIEHGALELRLPGGRVLPGRDGRPDRRHRHLERRLPPARTLSRPRLRRVVRRRRLAHQRPARPDRARRAQPRDAGAPARGSRGSTATAPTSPRARACARPGRTSSTTTTSATTSTGCSSTSR